MPLCRRGTTHLGAAGSGYSFALAQDRPGLSQEIDFDISVPLPGTRSPSTARALWRGKRQDGPPAFPKLGRHAIRWCAPRRWHTYEQKRNTVGPRDGPSKPRTSQALLAGGDGAPPVHLSWQVIDTWRRGRLPNRFQGASEVQLCPGGSPPMRPMNVISTSSRKRSFPLAGTPCCWWASAGWLRKRAPAMACKGFLADMPARPQARSVSSAPPSTMPSPPGGRGVRKTGVIVVQWGFPFGSRQARYKQPPTGSRSHARSPLDTPVVLWTNPGNAPCSHAVEQRQHVLRTVADGVRELLSTTPVSGLMIIGGDTAQASLPGHCGQMG